MIKLTKEQIKLLHSMTINETGGSDGIRDEGLLDSALNNPFQSFGGEELYPSIQSKAARMCYGLINNHAFVDGNKRIGVLSMMVFLELNKIVIECSDEELIDLGLGVASSLISDNNIMEWIILHSKK